MSTGLWIFWIISAFILGVLCADIWGNIKEKKAYGEGYAEGYKNGGSEKYNEVYNKRLLRQARRLFREEKKNEPVNPETGLGAVQGVAESSDSEPGSSESGLFEHDVDAGQSAEPSHE